MKIEKKKNSQLPYYLHDMHVNDIQIKRDKLKIYFDFIEHYDKDLDITRPVKAHIVFHEFDEYLSEMYVIKFDKKRKKLKGKSYSIKKFLKKYKDSLDLEIITENDDSICNVWTGILFKNKKYKADFYLKIVRDGKTVYHVEDEA